MQKNKKATIIIIIFILIYGLLSEFLLRPKINMVYTYLINPIIWIGIAVILKLTLGKSYEIKKLKKDIISYSLIAVLAYIITYLISGLFITFGKNPYSRTLLGIITNLWSFATVIIAKEYIRYKLINNVYEKDKIKIAAFLSTVYIIVDLGIRQFFTTQMTGLFIMETFAQTLLPLIMKNILYSYTAINSNYLPAMCYELGTKLYLWLSPILPNAPWIMTAIIDSVIPLILLLYITVKIGIRMIKMFVLEMIAPVPVMSYIDPKSAKDGAFASWLKQLISTFFDLFIRLGVVYIFVILINALY